MFWSLKTVLAISLVGLTTAQKPSPLCGTNPDATTFFRNMVTHTYPKALADYNAVIAAFPNSNATPEDIDDLYHAGEAYYRQYLDTFTTALSYVEVEILSIESSCFALDMAKLHNCAYGSGDGLQFDVEGSRTSATARASDEGYLKF
ncbi:hypothetical protein EST38_g12482 [Candolleomyces aberdarensis]|uniref:Uncharacterized protein n=1 Tax=Candolleomyces aberdarensis TaxID=2316362 RepID=A0A4Q2D4J0_9AGAR|nr:hypothetical protein EST38_g12482 [Candolleomyces aberdarensis]